MGPGAGRPGERRTPSTIRMHYFTMGSSFPRTIQWSGFGLRSTAGNQGLPGGHGTERRL